MSRRLFRSKQLLALLLPFALFSSWAACLVLCDETAAHHDDSTYSQLEKSGSDCSNPSVQPEGCHLTANAVVLQERQTVKAAALAADSSPVLKFRSVSLARTTLLPEIKQNSPPEFSDERLFVRLCTFRI